jgi:serine/threonine protein kinase
MSKKRIYGLGLEQMGRLLSLGTDCTDLGADPTKIEQGAGPDSACIKLAGTWVGRYKILRLLGEGGMGVVYLAEQTHPIQRQVALKLIKPGMDSARVIARFEAERQALALLDHPNIARVLDAGTTEAGRPYFVMEYVEGLAVVDYCDQHKLTVEKRLRLFLQVCQAVHHAHQKGIIHRDIKPSNILVSARDDQAVPKIIDFGVAKAVSQPLTERTLYTEQGQLIGTPEYMSPEQADMASEDIDTRSDIYSLGVLLYALLTGVLPFDSDTLRTGGIEHVRRIIREVDPKTPSTRLGKISTEESVKVAELRCTDIRTLGRKLHGDLDWITIKAMEKDRMRRYQTAYALAEDIQRHLNQDPVFAGPPSPIYRLKKRLHKHRKRLAIAGTVVVLLVALLIISVLYREASDRNWQADSIEHKKMLSEAHQLESDGKLEEALARVENILMSPHVGPEARLLNAWIKLKLQNPDELLANPDEALADLKRLLDERDEIASKAHFLMARIYTEADTGDPETELFAQKAREHQEAGEDIFAESADAYFNRAMMASSIPKTLELLSEALAMDPDHYASLEARTRMDYILGNYDEMEVNASMMIGNSSAKSSGYALRATARRHKAMAQNKETLLTKAIMDYSQAIGLSPEDPKLYEQRRQAHILQGNFEEALADARRCVQLDPEEERYPLDVFCALVSLGRFNQAEAQFSGIFRDDARSHDGSLGQLLKVYVFDVLAAGHELSLPLDSPPKAAFLPMLEAREDYARLASVARRVTGIFGGYAADWSPDGSKLAYSRGEHGSSGVETVDLASGETHLLAFPGMTPKWSPDGRYIAFGRDRRIISLKEFAGDRGYRYQGRPSAQQEIWFMRTDGTGQMRLAKGSGFCWSEDSKQVYYHSLQADSIYSVSVDEPRNTTLIYKSPEGMSPYAVICPKGKYLACASYASVRIVDMADGSLFRAWTIPTPNFGPALFSWSPQGNQLCIAGQMRRRLGTWIYDLNTDRATKVAGNTMLASLSKNNQLALGLSRPHFDIWIAKQDQLEAIQTVEQHRNEVLRFVTRRIQVYANDWSAYLWRARLYAYLQEDEKAKADLGTLAGFVNSPEDRIIGSINRRIAWAHYDQQYKEAELLSLTLFDIRCRLLGDKHADTLTVVEGIIKLYEAWGKPEKAEQWQKKLSAFSGQPSASISR